MTTSKHRLFFGCQLNAANPSRPQGFSLWSGAGNVGFDAHVCWQDQEPVQDDLWRRWGAGNHIEESFDGDIVQCCGDPIRIAQWLRAWLRGFEKAPEVWVVSVQDVAHFTPLVGMNRVPLYDISSLYRYIGKDFYSALKDAKFSAAIKAGSDMRVPSYVASELFNKVKNIV